MPIGQKPASTLPERQAGLVFRQGQKIFLGQFRADERGAETEFRKARQREGIGGVTERPGDQIHFAALEERGLPRSLQTKCFAPLRMASLMMRFQSSSSSGR